MVIKLEVPKTNVCIPSRDQNMFYDFIIIEVGMKRCVKISLGHLR